MTPALASVICALQTGKTMTMREISHRIVRDPSMVTPLVNRLQQMGYVEKKKSQIDGRAYEVKLTGEGEDIRGSVIRASRKMFVKLYRTTSYEERRTLMNMLGRIVNSM